MFHGFTADLRGGYHLTATGSATQTIAIVDAQDDPTVEADLATYRSNYGLPACTTANGCFRKVNQRGGSSYPSVDTGWAVEISLDVDMASAICPGCHILLVEADSASLGNLGSAVDEAAALGASTISNSYGGSERLAGLTGAASHYNHPGLAITASTGDSGYGVAFPATAPTVTAVGGTTLQWVGTTRTETAWSGAGSGCSTSFARPAGQANAGTGCSRHAVAVADPATGVAVYDRGGHRPRQRHRGLGRSGGPRPVAAARAPPGRPAQLRYTNGCAHVTIGSVPLDARPWRTGPKSATLAMDAEEPVRPRPQDPPARNAHHSGRGEAAWNASP